MQRIREIPTEVSVLVIDNECEKYHKEKKIRITNLLPNVLHISSRKHQNNDDKNDNLAKNMQVISVIGEISDDSNKIPEDTKRSDSSSS